MSVKTQDLVEAFRALVRLKKHEKDLMKKSLKVSKTKLKFYGVKTLYFLQVSGKVKIRPDLVDKKFDMYEERIILVKAKSFQHAIKKAEKEALDYESQMINPFGQNVKTIYLKCIDAFEMFDEDISDMCEIYSITSLVKKPLNKKRVLDIHFGVTLPKGKENNIRIKYRNSEFNYFEEKTKS